MSDLPADMKGRLHGATGGDHQLSSKEVSQLIADIREVHLSYCGPPKLENIAEAVEQVIKQNTPGLYLEAGVALGGSAILIAKLKNKSVPLHLYDVYSMIPPPGESDGVDAHNRYEVIRSGQSDGLGGDTYYGYVSNLQDVVVKNLERFGIERHRDNVELIAGLFENTINIDEPVAFAHIDCDWYDSVKICIDRITPQLSPGGIIIFDDYSSYSGCRDAVDEFLDNKDQFEPIFNKRSLGVRRLEK